MKDLRPIDNSKETGKPFIIAGPCSAETERQVVETACSLASYGIQYYRAGIWKPRTKPGGFEGVGKVGLGWLRKVKEETGMKVATEVANQQHVNEALDAGIDILWIGARTSANPFAMQEIADVLELRGADVPVLVKNPVNPDLELWIGALERLYNAGIRRLGAIHRGFSTYGTHLYRNSPQWYIPIELRRRFPALTILCDPSHIGGKRELIAQISQQAYDLAFDGLIVECHCCPDSAWSDSAQQLTPDMFNRIMESLVVRDRKSTVGDITALREQIDNTDNELLDVLNRRMSICREIGRYKKEHGMTIVQADRYDDIIQSRMKQAVELGMSEDFMKTVLSVIHEESVRQQLEIFKKDNTQFPSVNKYWETGSK